MFCNKCGSEIHDEAVICPYCGCGVSSSLNKPNKKLMDELSGVVIFGTIFIPLIGYIAGIVDLCRKKRTGWVYIGVAVGVNVLTLIMSFAISNYIP